MNLFIPKSDFPRPDFRTACKMNDKISQMSGELRDAFTRIKPVCDVVMVHPTVESVTAFTTRVGEVKLEAVQELQQYLLFPFITHIKSKEIEKKYELQWRMIDAMTVVLDRVTVNSYEMLMKIETGLMALIFDHSMPGMIAEVPEELKLSAMKCLTVLLLNSEQPHREKMLRTQLPLLAQAVFVSVHMAKLEKLRALRLAAIDCLMAHTSVHPKLTDASGHITSPTLEQLAVDMVSSILPGVLAALQDVATSAENPGHALVVSALNATHRILCLTMNDKDLAKKEEVTISDFTSLVQQRATHKEVSSEGTNTKSILKRSKEWFAMAGEKLSLVTQSLVQLRTHDHYKVRKELAVFCSRMLNECNVTMRPSVPLALDVLISLSKDEHPEVSQYCADAVHAYFRAAPVQNRLETMDSLVENFVAALNSLPRVLNNIDSSRKLSALNLLHGYITLLSWDTRPQRLTAALSCQQHMTACCAALAEAASVSSVMSMAQHATRDVLSPPPTTSPWCKLRHLDSEPCEQRLKDICRLIGGAECAELVLDALMEQFQQKPRCELVCVMNWMVTAPNSSLSLVTRVLNAYTEESVWYLPLEGGCETALGTDETMDVTVYNPRSWHKESVPDLYESATETRYTGISYQHPRCPRRDPNSCTSLAEAHYNMTLSCLLTEGVGIVAARLGRDFEQHLLRTLCLILERVGSKYEMLHWAGLKAINDIARACGHDSVAELIKCNADYFTHQVTVRLKKAWNTQSALQILSVVMEYSDSSILTCLYGIVEDVLVQSYDKYHEKDLHSYLQVFLTFITCIRKWFILDNTQDSEKQSKDVPEIDVLKDVMDYVNSTDEMERLLSKDEFEKEEGKTVEEMYREDQKMRDDDMLDYDDRVTEEKAPPPQHIAVTITIIKRCLHFITHRRREEAILTLQVLTSALPVLESRQDDLLPLVHQCWAPLVATAQSQTEPPVMRRALELLLTMASVAKDFIRSRSVKEVLPHLYKYLHKASSDSYLKDAGSAYRNSQAYSLQVAILEALPNLAVDLGLVDDNLDEAMACVDAYLSRKQPKPLQALAVEFFRVMLEHDIGSTWHHLRKLCGNDIVLQPPEIEFIKLEPIVGTPYEPTDKDYVSNIKLIFDKVK